MDQCPPTGNLGFITVSILFQNRMRAIAYFDGCVELHVGDYTHYNLHILS